MTGGLRKKVLLLNRTYEVLDVITIPRAVLLLFKEGDTGGAYAIMERSTGRVLHSPSGKVLDEPSVVRLTKYVPKRERIRKSGSRRRVVFSRDKFTCQYCGAKPGLQKLTLDHVIPESKGGPTSQENLVTACKPCNNRKADRTPEKAGMKLLNPIKPFLGGMDRVAPLVYAELRPDWQDFLFIKSDSDSRYSLTGGD